MKSNTIAELKKAYFLVVDRMSPGDQEVAWSFLEELESFQHEHSDSPLDPSIVILTDAKRRIEKGWRRDDINDSEDEDLPASTIATAIWWAHKNYCENFTKCAVYDENSTCSLWERTSELLDIVVGDSLFDFNNYPWTTKEDVLRAYDCAIMLRHIQMSFS